MNIPMITALQSAITEALASIPTVEAEQIYALSFYINNEYDDPRLPTLTVGYNTVDEWRCFSR